MCYSILNDTRGGARASPSDRGTAMISKIPPDHPLRRLFRGMVEQVFHTEIGICDTRVTDYLGELLGDFVHMDQIYRLRSVDGRAIREVSRMEAEALLAENISETQRRHLVNRYIGDFTLFWVGLYPETLHRRRDDRLTEYLRQGKQSYGIAGELAPPDSHPPGELLNRLSEEFECCVHGLHLVREGWRGQGPLDSN